MKNISKLLIFATAALFYTSTSSNELNFKDNDDCVVIVKSAGFASYFSLNGLSEFPVNNKVNPQYYWMTEVGELKDGQFIPNDFAYSATIPRGQKEAKYSIDELIEKSNVSLHFSTISLNIENEKKIQFGGFSLKPMEDGLMIASERADYYDKLFKDKPSYARMKFKTLNNSDSYICLTKINYLNQ